VKRQVFGLTIRLKWWYYRKVVKRWRYDMVKMQTPITWEQWVSLKRGDMLKDADGGIWRVTSRDPHDPKVISIAYEDRGDEEGLVFDQRDNQILLGEEWAIIIQLNHPSVTIIPAPQTE
jgi:hypothetical protein